MILQAGSDPTREGGPPDPGVGGGASPRRAELRAEEARLAAAEEERVLEVLRLAFAPLHKRAFGVAIGTAAGLLIAYATAFHVLFIAPGTIRLDLLSQYFYGYRVSWAGVFIGGAWGFGVGFIMGWFAAFCRNLAVAISVFITRTRAELGQTRDFLDHI
ncbi:MAG: hypothetical protein PVH00_07895 [Gemmatimonadota bacterium]|jgi:hypothetical protein